MRFLYQRGKVYNEVYHDQPIKPRYGYPIPEQIKAIRNLQRQDIRLGVTRNQSFVKAARLMADYEDNFRYDRRVSRHKPAYDSFSDIELRGYFGWRTGYKNGEDVPGGSYAEVYMNELLCGIGVVNAMDGYEKLRELQRRQGSELPTIEKMIIDYAVCYELPKELISGSEMFHDDRNIILLQDCGCGYDDCDKLAARFKAMLEVSKVQELAEGAPYPEHIDKLPELMCRCLDKVQAYSLEKRKKSFLEEVCGKPSVWPYAMLGGAVVDAEQKGSGYIYEVNPVRTFYGGDNWSVRRMSLTEKAGELMKGFVQAVYLSFMNVAEDAAGYIDEKNNKTVSSWMKKVIEETCRSYMQEIKLREERRVKIDFSRLDTIRERSAAIRDRLIVDEDEHISSEAVESVSCDDVVDDNNSGIISTLTELERRVIKAVLEGEDTGFVREEGQMLSVVVDSINEKLYDYFGDSILFDDGTLQIYEDYIEEVRTMIGI